jgi:putative oxidoreductase
MPFLRQIAKLAIAPLPVPHAWFAIPLRLIVGIGFFSHGYAKLARGWENFAGILHAIGMPSPDFLALSTIAAEIIGGLMILCGAFVPVASVPMIIVLLVAICTVHLPYGFSSIKLQSFDEAGAHFGQPGYETDLLYIAALIALCIGGAGSFSLDEYFTARRTPESRPAPSRESMSATTI